MEHLSYWFRTQGNLCGSKEWFFTPLMAQALGKGRFCSLEMYVLTKLPLLLSFCPKLSGPFQLTPAKNLWQPTHSRAAGPGCVLLFPKSSQKAPFSFPECLFLFGP